MKINALVEKDEHLDNRYIPINVSFDPYGNLYFDFGSAKSLQINVDGKNNLYGEEGEFSILDTKKDKLSKFQLVAEHSKLQYKTMKKLISSGVESQIHEVFDDDEIDPDMIDPYEEEIKYFPERADFFETDVVESDDFIDEELVEKYGHHNLKFNFSHLSGNDVVPIYHREDGDVTALYDTYIYIGGNLCFRSSSKEDESLYTIKIHDNGIIYFRPHGFSEQQYQLLFTKTGELLFIKS